MTTRGAARSRNATEALVREVASVVHRVRFEGICTEECRSYDIEDAELARSFIEALPRLDSIASGAETER